LGKISKNTLQEEIDAANSQAILNLPLVVIGVTWPYSAPDHSESFIGTDPSEFSGRNRHEIWQDLSGQIKFSQVEDHS
jgi:hypothetical protein